MKQTTAFFYSLLLLSLACSLSGNVTTVLTESATPSGETPPGPPTGRCGDGVCDGPENPQNCPQDCAGGTGEIWK